MAKSRERMLQFIGEVAADCGQTPLDKSCGKYFNLMYNTDNTIVVQSFEKNDGYGFTNINELSDRMVGKIYRSLLEDFD